MTQVRVNRFGTTIALVIAPHDVGFQAILGRVIELRPPSDDDVEAVAAVYVDSWNQGFGHLLGHRHLSQELIDRWRVDLAG